MKTISANFKKIGKGLAIAGLLIAALFFTQNKSSELASKEEQEEGRYPKAFMLEEMYKQWKEMLQDPNGEVPSQSAYSAWLQTEKRSADVARGFSRNSFTGISWTNIGPSNIGGRTRTMLISPSDITGNTAIAGSVGGGLWRSTNLKSASPTWSPIGELMDNLAISTLAYDPGNISTYYAGTGEGFNSADAARGFGIMKSTNGGTSWAFLPNTQNSSFYYVNKLVITASGVILAATNNGIMRSTDGGSVWANVQGGSIGDLERAANGMLFASTKNGGAGVYRSSNNGLSWTIGNTGLPTGLTGYSRYEMAVAPSDSNRVYAMVYNYPGSSTVFYKSIDAGLNYTAMATPVDADAGISSTDITRGQGWYDLIMRVDPNNADVVYAGGVDLFKTTDAGTGWTQISHWYGGFSKQYAHADQHGMEFEGTNSNVLYFTNDGGIFQTTNATAAVPTINARNNNYCVTQFYGCAINPAAGNSNYLAGAQDNGTQRFTSASFNYTSPISGGDGAYCNIDQKNPTYQFSQYVFNNYYRSNNSGASFNSVSNGFSNTGRFINPTRYDDSTKALYAATSSGYFLRWANANTGSIFGQILVTAFGTQTVSAITVSPTKTDRVYFGTGLGQIVEVDNASTVVGSTPGRSLGSPNTGYLNNICLDPNNTNHIIAIYSGFGRVNIYETLNALATTPTWVSKEGDLPDMPVFWVLPYPGSETTKVLIATEYGVWTTDNFNAATPNWLPANTGFARVRTTQLYYRASDNMVVASTFGRGLYTATLPMINGCGMPASLSVSGLTNNAATLSWSAVAGANNYNVQYKAGSSSTWIVADSATSALSINLTGLSGGGTYDWKVSANCASGSSLFSAAQFSTLSNCIAPSGLSTTNISSGGATLNWTASTGALNYDVDYKAGTDASWTNLAVATANTSATVTGLLPATAYDWRVRTNCTNGYGSAYTQSAFNTAAATICTDKYEVNNTSSSAKTIPVNATINAGISTAADVDWFKITSPNTTSTNLKISLGNLAADYDVYLYSKNLVLLASATATGTGSETAIYNSTAKKATYYIKVVGKNGAFNASQCYSLIAATSTTAWPIILGSANFSSVPIPDIEVYPNPASSMVYLRFESPNAGEANLRLMMTNGSVLSSTAVGLSAGTNLLYLQMSDRKPGLYLVQVVNGEINFTRKVMIVR